MSDTDSDADANADADVDKEAALDELAQELVSETKDKHAETQEAQAEFLESVAQETGAELLETQCNIVGDYTVTLKTKLSGDILDRMGRLEDRIERLEAGNAAASEVGETADEIAQLLADLIDGADWHKAKFYAAYEAEGLNPLGVMVQRAFESLRDERERRHGAADGFRQE
jgi:uncharacterized protein YpuA (DUF1002 family)